ncbi:Uncharacterized protein dnm_085020 [Desulfonema magnum]|uniref:Uncharacterized protein n=1 Tax=Desulfonema magnum TaxID=45655 RepID=A0A975BW15_9BACT|nr:Uncharacterized protein dnm_085020 [Desulfonema magnum]
MEINKKISSDFHLPVRISVFFFTVKIHFEKPGFLYENIFITGGEKPHMH